MRIFIAAVDSSKSRVAAARFSGLALSLLIVPHSKSVRRAGNSDVYF